MDVAAAVTRCTSTDCLGIASTAAQRLASSFMNHNRSLYDTSLDHSSEVIDMQALGQRCMSAEAIERPKFDEVLLLVDELDVDA